MSPALALWHALIGYDEAFHLFKANGCTGELMATVNRNRERAERAAIACGIKIRCGWRTDANAYLAAQFQERTSAA